MDGRRRGVGDAEGALLALSLNDAPQIHVIVRQNVLGLAVRGAANVALDTLLPLGAGRGDLAGEDGARHQRVVDDGVPKEETLGLHEGGVDDDVAVGLAGQGGEGLELWGADAGLGVAEVVGKGRHVIAGDIVAARRVGRDDHGAVGAVPLDVNDLWLKVRDLHHKVLIDIVGDARTEANGEACLVGDDARHRGHLHHAGAR